MFVSQRNSKAERLSFNQTDVHSKKSIMNHGDLLASKLCIALDNMSYVGYHDITVGVSCTKLLQHRLIHVTVNRPRVRILMNALISCKQIAMIRYGFLQCGISHGKMYQISVRHPVTQVI